MFRAQEIAYVDIFPNIFVPPLQLTCIGNQLNTKQRRVARHYGENHMSQSKTSSPITIEFNQPRFFGPFTRKVLALAVIGTLAACGGQSTGTQASNDAPALSQSADNAQVTAAAAIEAFATASGSTTGDFVPTAAVSALATDVGALAVTTTVRFCSSPPAGAVDTGKGNVTTVVNDADPVGRSTGDSVTETFNNCVQGARTTNGTHSHTINTLTGTPGTGVFTLDTTRMTDKTTTTATSSSTTKGTSTVKESSTDGVTTTRSIIGTDSHTRTAGTATNTSTEDINMTGSTNAANNTFTHSGNIKSTSTTRGTHEVATPTPLSGTIGAPPTAGVILITHTPPAGSTATKSITRITAQADGTVLLEVDSNGDGVVDTTTTTTWAGLIGIGAGPVLGFGRGGAPII